VNETKHFNIENEKAVVASVLLKGTEALEKALNAGVEPCTIYDERLRLVYRAELKLAGRKEPIDALTVKNVLEENGDLKKVDVVFLADLTSGIPAALNVQAYAEQVMKDYRHRRLMESLSNALQTITSDPGAFARAKAELLRDLIEQDSGKKTEHKFEQITEDNFRLSFPEISTIFEVDRLRREHNELLGEICVRCGLPGVSTYDGALSIADINLSSARARAERARLLSDRSSLKELDWVGCIEEFCQRVLAAERMGQPAVDLRSLERPTSDYSIKVEGLILPRRHPAFIFGDGGAAKSYTGLYLAGCLVNQGLAVALFDWELSGEDHRDRLERLFGQTMPKILYARCEKALVYETDRLRRIVREEKVDYAIFDSVAFACDGPPESAEIAGRYFRAVRQIGIGSLHIAHITKGEGGEEKPFGSVFWHNGARATWFAKIVNSATDAQTLSLGLFQKKANLGGLAQPAGFEIYFGKDRTHFNRKDPSDNPELAAKMPVRQQMIALLRRGAMGPEEIAMELEANQDTIKRTARRYKNTFKVFDNGKVALLQRNTA
jgi:hypothetical protein